MTDTETINLGELLRKLETDREALISVIERARKLAERIEKSNFDRHPAVADTAAAFIDALTINSHAALAHVRAEAVREAANSEDVIATASDVSDPEYVRGVDDGADQVFDSLRAYADRIEKGDTGN